MDELTEGQLDYLRALDNLRIAYGKAIRGFKQSEWDELYIKGYIETKQANYITGTGSAELMKGEG